MGGRRASVRVAVDDVESNFSEFTTVVGIFGYGREVKVGVKWAKVCIFQWTNETCLFGFCFGIGSINEGHDTVDQGLPCVSRHLW